MSWGGSEFLGQQAYDSYFTTPSGHIPETFIAASGDSGQYGGAQWPASSTNVMAVGGTTLYSANSTGAYGTETGWDGSSGGLSSVVGEPAYQSNAVGLLGARAVPDVAYDADPNTGFAVYDSVSYDGVAGWQEIGGTSAGAPQWAALIAIANQQRLANHQTTLDGVSEALSAMYASYSAPGTTGYASYTGLFHDVTSGGGSYFFGGGASEGYDLVTGLGSPNAPSIVSALAGAAPVANAGAVTKTPATTSHWHASRFASADLTVQTTSAPAQSTSTSISLPALTASKNTGQVLGSNHVATRVAVAPSGIQAAPSHHYDAAVWTAILGTATADVAAGTSEAIVAVESAAAQTVHAAKLVSVKLADVVAAAADAPVEVAAETHVWLQLANLDASVFADSMRAFAHESAALEATTLRSNWSRSVAVTAAAILSDTILVGYWYFGRARRKAKAAAAENSVAMAAR
jgi:subtilase family serine protease